MTWTQYILQIIPYVMFSSRTFYFVFFSLLDLLAFLWYFFVFFCLVWLGWSREHLISKLPETFRSPFNISSFFEFRCCHIFRMNSNLLKYSTQDTWRYLSGAINNTPIKFRWLSFVTLQNGTKQQVAHIFCRHLRSLIKMSTENGCMIDKTY